jgi:hypothetical protein
MIGMPSPNHVTDPDQRALSLEFEPAADGSLVVTAPPSGKVAPPNSYYLVVNKRTEKGPVPSVARIVRVGTGRDMTDAIAPFPTSSSEPTGGSITPLDDSSVPHEAPKEAAAQTAALQSALEPAAQAAPARADGVAASPPAAPNPEAAVAARPVAHRSPLRSTGVPAAAAVTAAVVLMAGRRRLRRAPARPETGAERTNLS